MHVTSRSALTEMSAININTVLMKCHLDLGVQDLMQSAFTVSRIFINVMNMLNIKLNFLVKWPSQDLLKTMPMCLTTNFGTKVTG